MVLRGAVAGALATLPMSAVLAVARTAGMPGPLPPVLLVRHLLPGLAPPREAAAGAVLHVAIGAACGAVWAGPLHGAPRAAVPFGAAVWALGYRVLMPLAGVLPPAQRDARTRQVPLVAAHLVFGVALRLLARRR